MSQILNRIRDLDPNDSDAVKDALNTFFQNLSNRENIDCNRWLRVLENIITRFPKYCSTYRDRIEHHIVHFLATNNNYYDVIEAAKCAHALQQVRPSQDKTATSKNCWREQMSILCNTAHMLIEAIFSKTVDIYKNTNKTQKQGAKLLASAPMTTVLGNILKVTQTDSVAEKKTILCNRLRNVFVFIQAMLVEVYPVPKPIQPQLILEVIVQALSVSSSVNSDATHSTVIKTQALRTLDAMVACLGPNLVPYSALVFRFVMQTLRWSSDNVNEESRKVRCTAYASASRCLGSLLCQRAAAADSRGRAAQDELAAHILDDITPPKQLVQLTMSKMPTKNLSKKARRKLANSMLQQSNISNHMPGEKNKISVSEATSDEVAIAALECAETFLTVCGIFLKPATHKMFQERLVRECFNIDSYTSERGERLLRALDASRKSCPPAVPPPTQYCLQLYTRLLNSKCHEITKFCSQALLDIRLHLHCSPPSINFALEPQPEKRKAEDNRKRISEKNRAVLESLLGRERLPSEVQEEVITISDEPSTKKPRLSEDITDKISVSSESINSLEISDDSDVEESLVQEVSVIIENKKEAAAIEKKTDTNIVANESINQSTQKPIEINDNSGDNGEPRQINTQENDTDSVKDTITIHEAKTQVPLNVSNLNDTEDGEKSPVSMEVGYDDPSVTSKVTVLEKMDDENLPSTNDTDDVQITCGQDVRISQEVEVEKSKAVEEVPTVNGIDEVESGEKIIENGDDHEKNLTLQVVSSIKEVTVDDMLADFVDEVNDDSRIEA